MRVLTVAEVRALDRFATERLGIPSLVLMENAALGVADAIGDRFPEARRVAIACGPGNNGADGLAVGRQLATRGYEVELLLARFGRELSADCARQLAIVERLELPLRELAEAWLPEEVGFLGEADVLVDALFGSGLTRPLEGAWARLVEALGAARRPIVAIDLPSGLDGDRAAPIGPAVRADLTVSFVAPKPALLLDPACDLCGELLIADLGFPVDEGGGPGALHLLVAEELAGALVRRSESAHKGSFGHLLLVCGSIGKSGAAVLAARAAVAAGAGLVTVALPGELHGALADACPEAMTLPLPAENGALSRAGLEALLAAAAERTVVAIGPGLGRANATEELVRALALATDRPLVLDADGLNAFEGRLDELARRSAPTVLTPHPGELARLLGSDSTSIQADRLGAAREAARRGNAIVALKGRGTIVAAPDGEAWINTTGNPGMASGGSGDVLTGIVGARLAQGDEPTFATCLSVQLHGAAGDLALARLGGPAVPAGELIASFGAAYSRLAGRVRSWSSTTVDETRAVGRRLAGELVPDGVLLLHGGLGAGKTVLVQGLAEGLGLDPRDVQSPTYTLVREHRAPGSSAARLVHVDLYRLEPGEVEAAGIEELLLGPGVKAVEWAERLPFALEGALELEVVRSGDLRTIRETTPAPAPGGPR